MLRLLANQIVADEGKIWIDDVELTRLRGWRRPVYRRNIGQVWQDASLIRKKTGAGSAGAWRQVKGNSREYPESFIDCRHASHGGPISV